jgi:hypothetical protein
MTSLESLTPKVEVLPPTKGGKARAVLVYPGLRAEEYECDAAAVIEEQGKAPEGYGLTEFPAGGGRAFRMKKVPDGDEYTVYCATADGWSSCTCPAATYGKVARCRHLETVAAILNNQWL